MGVTIHVNGTSNSLVHQGSSGIAKSTLPDVCKTPCPAGPVPIPYPIIVSMSSDLKKGSKKVKFDGGKSGAIKGSEFSRCSGDEAGTVGGVKSSTNMKEATWLLYSFDVKIEGKNACRLSDKMMMNHGNTACLAGATNTPVAGDDGDERLSNQTCEPPVLAAIREKKQEAKKALAKTPELRAARKVLKASEKMKRRYVKSNNKDALLERKKLLLELKSIRQEEKDTCFRNGATKGDQESEKSTLEHEKQIAFAQKGADNIDVFIKKYY